MPRKAIDYSKTIIYKIECGDESYVGNTCNFRSRKADHKKACNNPIYKEHNYKIYQTIRANGGWEKAMMTPIELFPCSSSIEARIREEYWRKELQSQMNTKKAFITEEEKIEYYREHIKKYREEHRDEVLEYKKKYNKQKFTCECGTISNVNHKQRHFKTKKHQTFIGK
jgi:hypothetical protein